MRLLSKFIFFITGWKVAGAVPKDIEKAVVVAAPHTSMWDFIYVTCAFSLMRLPMTLAVKKEMFFFPLGSLLKSLGAMPIDRKPKSPGEKKLSTVDAMVNLFDTEGKVFMVVAPEGTRKQVKRWKTGFYRVAEGAGVPIVLGYLDYKTKRAGIGPTIHLSGDMEADIEKIMKFYRPIVAKYPEKGVK